MQLINSLIKLETSSRQKYYFLLLYLIMGASLNKEENQKKNIFFITIIEFFAYFLNKPNEFILDSQITKKKEEEIYKLIN